MVFLCMKALSFNYLWQAMHYLFENETSPFMKVKAMDVLFKGLEFDCSSHKFEARVREREKFLHVAIKIFLCLSLLCS
jgi:hypothetical protein